MDTSKTDLTGKTLILGATVDRVRRKYPAALIFVGDLVLCEISLDEKFCTFAVSMESVRAKKYCPNLPVSQKFLRICDHVLK